MGWTGTYTDRPAHEVVTEELEYGGQWKVIARSGRYYVIEKRQYEDWVATDHGRNPIPVPPVERLAVVALVERGEGMVYTKLVDETMGPNERKCPTRLLDLLPDTDNEYAAQWRADCRAYHEARKAQPRLKAGDIVRFAKPITFRDGVERDTFTFVKQFTFRSAQGVLVRLPRNWKTAYEWEVVTTPGPTVEQPKPKSRAHDLRKAVSDLPPFAPMGDRTTTETPTVKLFTPDGAATWFLTEYDPEEELLFGLCDLGIGFPELGYVSLTELEEVKGVLGLAVEVDLYWGNKPLADAYRAIGEEVPEWLTSEGVKEHV